MQIVDIRFVTEYHYLVFGWKPNNLVSRIIWLTELFDQANTF